MENLIVASSNLVAILPIISAYRKSDYITLICLFLAMSASVLYHLMETEKHQFPGIFSLIKDQKSRARSLGRKWHLFLINLDRLAAITVIIRVVYKYMIFDRFFILYSVVGLLCLLVSEIRKDSYWIYLLSHCLWHIFAFNTANLLINN